MQLQTQIHIEKIKHQAIDYNSKILLLGSCFSENIGNKLDYFKFQVLQNPFGILFHPTAIENLLTNTINEKYYTEKDIFFHNERWHCFDAHSKLSNPMSYTVLNQLNEQIKKTKKQLQDSTHTIITLGTAWVYRFTENNTIVANCHKVPQKKFTKEILSVEQLIKSLENSIKLLKNHNPSTTIIFTVSPVRHLKDGFIENTQSKSHLLTAIHQIINKNKDVFYFPSYEIMMDELRDYRFYSEDMLHPNKLAIEYIWEKFTQTWITDESLKITKEIEHIQKGIEHRPFNEKSTQHQKFLQKLELKIELMKKKLPHISF